MDTVGLAFTTIFLSSEPVQLYTSFTVAVYSVVADGETVMDCPIAPVLQFTIAPVAGPWYTISNFGR
jgi:hypothetical protein